MPVLDEAQRFYREQRRLTARALDAAVALWGDRPPADFDAWFDAHVDDLVGIITTAQDVAVGQALDYVGTALTTGGGDITPDFDPDPSGLVGIAGDGRPLESLLYGAIIHTRAAIAKAPDTKDPNVIRRAWAEQGIAALIARTQTSIADAGRVATGLGTIARPDTGYTRLLVGSSCSRCAVLAGRVYHSMIAFDRHPCCDCRHVPRRMAESLEDSALDVRAYFESLSTAEQDRKFTKAGAQAIRDGADPAQVVNARRGAAGLASAAGRVTSAEAAAIRSGRLRNTTVAGGRQLATTTEAMTKRGRAFKVIAQGDAKREAEIRAGKRQRLMPEAIYEVAGSREEALGLLRRNGYLTAAPSKSPPPPKVPGEASAGGPSHPSWMTFSANVPAADRVRITGALGRVPTAVRDRLAGEGLRYAVGRTLSDLPDAQLRGKWSGRHTADGRSLEDTSFYSTDDAAVVLSTDGRHGSVSVELHEYGHAVDDLFLRNNPVDVVMQDQGAENLLGPLRGIAQQPRTKTVAAIIDDPYVEWAHARVRATSAPDYYRTGSVGTAKSGRSEWIAEGFAAAVQGRRDQLLKISGGDEQAADMLVWSLRRLEVLP